MTELGKGIIQDSSQMQIDTTNPIIEEENEMGTTDLENVYSSPLKNQSLPYKQMRNDPLGLNPLNYANQSVEEEVQMELLAAQ
jgi:hypothetical protein